MNTTEHKAVGCEVCLLHDVLYGECYFVVRKDEVRHLNPADVHVINRSKS